MGEETKINPKHSGMRIVLRILGPICLLAGVLCIAKGVSMFGNDGAAEGFTIPKYMFGGMALLFVGGVMTMFGFLGAAARYQAAEVAPVVKDTFNYVADGTRDGVKTVASAVGQGIAEGMRSAGGTGGEQKVLVRCHKCNAENDASAKFCDQCGAALSKSCPCEACGELNDPDAKFCDNCGKATQPQQG